MCCSYASSSSIRRASMSPTSRETLAPCSAAHTRAQRATSSSTEIVMFLMLHEGSGSPAACQDAEVPQRGEGTRVNKPPVVPGGPP